VGIAERKQREFERREAGILEAALALFDEDDWERVTVDEIAGRAEIGKGTVYKHFPTKLAIYARLALDFYDGLLSGMQDLLDAEEREAGAESDPVPALRALIGYAFRYHLSHSEHRRVVQCCARDDFRHRVEPEYRQAFDALDERFLHFIGTLLERGIASGRFPERPVLELTWGLRATFDGAVALLWNGCYGYPIDVEDYTWKMTNYMLAGLVYQDQLAGR